MTKLFTIQKSQKSTMSGDATNGITASLQTLLSQFKGMNQAQQEQEVDELSFEYEMREKLVKLQSQVTLLVDELSMKTTTRKRKRSRFQQKTH